jgi:hypothetical protein
MDEIFVELYMKWKLKSHLSTPFLGSAIAEIKPNKSHTEFYKMTKHFKGVKSEKPYE